MADLTITAASVKPVAGYTWMLKLAGEAITQGQILYLNAADDKLWKADANASAAAAAAVGVALTNSAADQPCVVQTAGDVDIGATVAAATQYIASATAGGLAPIADLASGWNLTTIGYGITTSRLRLNVKASGIPLA